MKKEVMTPSHKLFRLPAMGREKGCTSPLLSANSKVINNYNFKCPNCSVLPSLSRSPVNACQCNIRAVVFNWKQHSLVDLQYRGLSTLCLSALLANDNRAFNKWFVLSSTSLSIIWEQYSLDSMVSQRDINNIINIISTEQCTVHYWCCI